MLDEVEIIPVLHKVTGAGHSCKGGGGTWGCGHWGGGGVVVSEFSVVWGKRGEGGQGREGVQLPDSLMDEAVLQSAGPRLETPQSPPWWQQTEEAVCRVGGWDHLQCWGLCGWDGCCRCPGGRGERHQRSSQLLSLSIEGTCGCLADIQLVGVPACLMG